MSTTQLTELKPFDRLHQFKLIEYPASSIEYPVSSIEYRASRIQHRVQGEIIMNASMEIQFPGGRKVYCDYKGFTIKTDQSKEDGGDHTASTPSDLFFAAVGACMGLYALDFCKRRKIDPAQLKISVEVQSHDKTRLVEKMIYNIDLAPEFPQKYTSALIRAMKLCYLKKHFEYPPQFEFVTHQK